MKVLRNLDESREVPPEAPTYTVDCVCGNCGSEFELVQELRNLIPKAVECPVCLCDTHTLDMLQKKKGT